VCKNVSTITVVGIVVIVIVISIRRARADISMPSCNVSIQVFIGLFHGKVKSLLLQQGKMEGFYSGDNQLSLDTSCCL